MTSIDPISPTKQAAAKTSTTSGPASIPDAAKNKVHKNNWLDIEDILEISSTAKDAYGLK